MRCGTRLTSTWMVAGEIGELSWGTGRSCSWLLHILHGLPVACAGGQSAEHLEPCRPDR